jgi:hypothetical protein
VSALGASHDAGPATIPWASRAGRGRRYEETLPMVAAPRGALHAPVDEEDAYAVGPPALLQARSAAGLATLGVRPGGRVVHGGGARRAIAIAADGADAALYAIGFEGVLAEAARDGWDVIVDASGAGLEALAEELRARYDEVRPLPPAPDPFAAIEPYGRRRGEMLRATMSVSKFR